MVSLFAIAGGAPPAIEEYLAWGVALLIPVDYVLTILAVYKNSLKISYFSIFIMGMVFSLALLIGFTYEHSEDEDEVAKQRTGWSALRNSGALLLISTIPIPWILTKTVRERWGIRFQNRDVE